MKIVIDIPDNYMSLVKSAYEIGCAPTYNVMIDICRAVANGTPLPKEHGRLIDAEDLAKVVLKEWDVWEKKGKDCCLFAYVITPLLVSMQTIIEASEVE